MGKQSSGGQFKREVMSIARFRFLLHLEYNDISCYINIKPKKRGTV